MQCKLSSSVNLLMAGILLISLGTGCGKRKDEVQMIDHKLQTATIDSLVAKWGEAQRERITTGVRQVAAVWRESDGSKTDFAQFCREYFVADQAQLEQGFQRLETTFETISGTLVELERQAKWQLDVECGDILPIDYLIGNFSLSSHLSEDLFKTKIAGYVLLNYKVYALSEVLAQAAAWDRQQWAEWRLTEGFKARVPAEVNQKRYETYVAADNYISNYNIYLHNLLTESGERLWPEGLKLISHWGLRDELKAQYDYPDGLARQQLIYAVMLKIVTQEIPAVVINNDRVDWRVSTNTVSGMTTDNQPEPDTRYRQLQQVFRAERACDPYYPVSPTKILRRFNDDRQIPEEIVEQLFVSVLTSAELKATAQLIAKRLGRDLQPFDIWYNGFKAKDTYTQAELDKLVAKKFPTAEVFKKQLPEILTKLGFEQATASFLSSKIEVDAARGSGHAMGAGRRSDNAHLRTRVVGGGMNYKGFNIAMHELGHCVEQVFSLNRVDHTLLQGVPNTAFTEAFAFVFQDRDLQVLGLGKADPQQEHLKALKDLWAMAEISSVALVDMAVWHWMYDHPEASAAELKEATLTIAKDIWNKYWAPLIGIRDIPLLAIYSHMIDAGLYLPDYPLGHIIAFQIEQYIKDKHLAREMERMCVQGSINPNFWMRGAVGADISVQPLLTAAGAALQNIQ